jgi:hypothetical protein
LFSIGFVVPSLYKTNPTTEQARFKR